MSFKPIFIVLSLAVVLVSCKQSNEQLLNKGYKLSKQKKYDKAIEIYTDVIRRNDKLQLAYYNRGFAYVATKQYNNALADFNKVMSLQTFGSIIMTYNQESPFADEEARAQVPYNDALYQRAQVKYFMDSLASSFTDFQTLVDKGYEEKSNCLLWQGTICVRGGQPSKGCEYFNKAKEFALTDDDKKEADEMIKIYCGQTNNNR
ncbi:MAG: hypothetical protein U0U70_10820 [Chitinophagaceae bacterium]